MSVAVSLGGDNKREVFALSFSPLCMVSNAEGIYKQ